MRGIILAAGRGSRMGGLTREQPKCLTVLAGRPLIQWQREALERAGVGPIGVVAGYREEQLRPWGDEVFVNADWAATNMVVSLRAAGDWLESRPCVVSYSDIVYHPRIVERLAAASGDVTITYDRCWAELWSDRFADPLIDAETFRKDPRGRLLEIGSKARSMDDVEGQYMGLFKVTPDGWRRISSFLEGRASEVSKMDMTTLLSGLLDAGVEIETVAVDGRWCEVDSGSDLELYEQKLGAGAWRHDWRW